MNFNGYKMTKLKTMQGRDGEAFSAEIQKDGKTVLWVRNEGCGGCNFYDNLDPEDFAEFNRFAIETYGEGFEVEDRLTEALLIAAEFSKKRSVVYILDSDGDPFDWLNDKTYGACRTWNLPKECDLSVTMPHYIKEPFRVWDKKKNEFVRV